MVLPQLPINQTVPHIDGVDAFRLSLQETVGKSPSRASDVQAHRAGGIDLKLLKGRGQFLAGSADISGRFLHIDPRTARDQFGGLVDLNPIDQHPAG